MGEQYGFERVDREERFRQAKDDSWWYCLEPTCHRAFRKSECTSIGVCPHCNGFAFNSLPWEIAQANCSNLPEIPVSGESYSIE